MKTEQEKQDAPKFGCDDMAANRRLYCAEIRQLAETYAAMVAMEEDAPDDWQECRDILKLADEAGYPDGCEPNEWISEVINHHSWAIYTYTAQMVRLCSDTDWREEAAAMGLENPTDEQIAYLCMVADVREEAKL